MEDGEIKVGDQVKIFRQENEIGLGEIKELQQGKEKTGSVRVGMKFGYQLKSFITPAPGDKLQAFKIIKK